MAFSVLIVDDDDLFAEFLGLHLAADGRFEVIGRARDGLEALRLVPELDPDVVTMDIEMPKLDGLEATRRLLAANPETRVAIVSSSIFVEPARQARAGGAAAYVSKARAIDELTGVLLAVCSGAEFIEAF